MAIASQATDRQTVLNQDFRMLIGGELVESESREYLTSQDPATGESLAPFPNATPNDVDKAVTAAKAALPGWRALPMSQRQEVVLEIARRFREGAEAYGLLDTLDTGNVLSAMRLDATSAADGLEYYVALSYGIKGEVTHVDNNLHYTRRQPFGVVGRLLPFNHPINTVGMALGPPLLTGNCVIVKPSPHTPLSALALARAIKDVAPPGVINIVTGDNERVAAPLIRHPGVGRIALTGSVEAGRTVMRLASDMLKTVTLELGGKNPLIIFPDVDAERAAKVAIAGMNFKWQSHSCGSTSRILVHKSLHSKFVNNLVEGVQQLRVGLPTEPTSDMGAISHKAQYDKTLYYLDAGKKEGAQLRTGGVRPSDPELQKGFFLTPAVFDNAHRQMKIAQEEIFGPVMTVLEWDDYDDMLELANGVIYGLTAVILTNDLKLAHRTAEAIEAGYIEINDPVAFAAGSPFGGFKQSGFGREGTVDELLSYTQIKSVNINLQ